MPLTEWNERKVRVKTNVDILPSSQNGLTKRSIADCLQTRPIDYRKPLVSIFGQIDSDGMMQINQALKVVFELM